MFIFKKYDRENNKPLEKKKSQIKIYNLIFFFSSTIESWEIIGLD